VTFSLYLDEDVDPALGLALTTSGLNVLSTRDAGRSHRGLADEDQLLFAAEQDRAILTHNTPDFEWLAIAWANTRRMHAGIILARRASVGALAAAVRQLQTDYPDGIPNYCLRLPRV